MSRIPHTSLLALSLTALTGPVSAGGVADIGYRVSGGNVYQYTVHNNSLGGPWTDFC